MTPLLADPEKTPLLSKSDNYLLRKSSYSLYGIRELQRDGVIVIRESGSPLLLICPYVIYITSQTTDLSES